MKSVPNTSTLYRQCRKIWHKFCRATDNTRRIQSVKGRQRLPTTALSVRVGSRGVKIRDTRYQQIIRNISNFFFKKNQYWLFCICVNFVVTVCNKWIILSINCNKISLDRYLFYSNLWKYNMLFLLKSIILLTMLYLALSLSFSASTNCEKENEIFIQEDSV